MTADEPTILATSGGIRAGRRVRWEFNSLTEYAIELAGVDGRAPRVCGIGTAVGDDSAWIAAFYAACGVRGLDASHLALFPMPNVDDITELLLGQDVIWATGGSVAGLLAMWDLHGVGAALRQAWEAGVVLTGVSAGSICWHTGGTTDSFGPDLRPVTNGLGFVPFSNGVHYDSEEQRRPKFQAMIADATLPAGYATDDGAGLLYRGTRFVEAVAERDGAGAYYVERSSDATAVETRLDIRRLR
ncbi:peptidase E [Jatrophihabitans sp. GAS493]|uniref:Type 1 glutamine amidotransferase-like domain-containing protein n=1 Tax=Jatrophihabitans sp. GAS493 TaxID=1907575 RepID=UPI000BB925B4|nr:peptidase E [Jatrophihabitans sp. GAS493]SOD74412.1 peptidase E [Jatrophihabitans sp. GAS493]